MRQHAQRMHSCTHIHRKAHRHTRTLAITNVLHRDKSLQDEGFGFLALCHLKRLQVLGNHNLKRAGVRTLSSFLHGISFAYGNFLNPRFGLRRRTFTTRAYNACDGNAEIENRTNCFILARVTSAGNKCLWHLQFKKYMC